MIEHLAEMGVTPLVLPNDRYLVEALPEIWFGVVLFTLGMYVMLDGMDFGIGVIFGTRTEEGERETLLAAFGPIWDANEVWLVAFGTTLLGAFPVVYSRLLADHYLLAIASVLALLFRGVGPELREQREDPAWRRHCDRIFVGGSIAAPVLLGTLVGAWVFDTTAISPISILTGFAVLAISIVNGATFLAAKTSGSLQREMRRYGLVGTIAYLAIAVALLVAVVVRNPVGTRGTVLSPLGIAIVLGTVAAGIGGIGPGRAERDRLRLVSTAAMNGLLIVLIATLLYPSVYPPSVLLGDAIVSYLALNLLTVLGLPVLVLVMVYFRLLYGVFSGPVEGSGYSD